MMTPASPSVSGGGRRLVHLFFLTLWPLLLVSSSAAFAAPPNGPQQGTASASSTRLSASSKPILVVGATGRVGRLVVEQLLEQNCKVRAVVRNETKAQEVFGKSTSGDTNLEFVKADLGRYDDVETQDTLDSAVDGCDAVISVSGTMRFSKITDFLPWRLFRTNVTSWCDDDRSHPYYTNYQAQAFLVDLATKYKVGRFVRLTGLTVGLPAFSLISILFSGLLSMSSRYNSLCEQYLRESSVPHVILRPGGLISKDRNSATTALQVDPSGVLPPPARVGRADVAALAIGACELPSDKSYTLAVRWVGDVAPKAQGTKKDGCDTAEECVEGLEKSTIKFEPPKGIKPYGAAVGLFFYSFAAISIKLLSMAFGAIRAALKL